jgi:hypothetical protein
LFPQVRGGARDFVKGFTSAVGAASPQAMKRPNALFQAERSSSVFSSR